MNLSSQKLFDYCQQKLSEEEMHIIEQKIQKSEELKEIVYYLRRCIDLKEDINEIEAMDIRKICQRDLKKIRKQQSKLQIRKWTKYAAFLSIPLLITSFVFAYLFLTKVPLQASTYAEVNTLPGTITRYELPDKSVVWLNAGSKLRYPLHFTSEKREVDLEGEAYFEVKSDLNHPFYVNTSQGLQVYVYGTRFNVCAYADDSSIETTLERGKVNVILPYDSSEIVLLPGEGVWYNVEKRKIIKSKVDVYEKTAWKDGKIIFRKATVEKIFARLSRHFNVDIILNAEKKNKGRYRATFTSENLEQILTYLSRSINMKWKMAPSVRKRDGSYQKKKIQITFF